jgi:hypothetical protein
MEGLLKSKKIPVFEGKHEKFAPRSYTFLSACAISGWKQVLLDDNIAVPAESENLNPVTDAELLLFSCICFTYCCCKRCDRVFRQSEMVALMIYLVGQQDKSFELEQKFNQCQLLKEIKNPEEWFTELEHIRLLLKEDHSLNYDNDKMIQHIIYNIKAKGYETLVFYVKKLK